MTAAGSLIRLADDFVRLPFVLGASTSLMPEQTRGQPRSNPRHVIPIRLDVSELIRDIIQAAKDIEDDLRVTFRMGGRYWTKPRRTSVPDSLRWSAGILDDPPSDDPFHPGVVPTDVAVRIEGRADGLERRTYAALGGAPRVDRRACPRCGSRSLFTSPVDDTTLCVRCGHMGGQLEC